MRMLWIVWAVGVMVLAGCSPNLRTSPTLATGTEGVPAGESYGRSLNARVKTDPPLAARAQREQKADANGELQCADGSNARSAGSKVKADANFPNERAEFFLRQRRNADGSLPLNPVFKANEALRELQATAGVLRDGDISPVSWDSLGPGNVGGRIRGIVVHAERTNEMLVGSASGGVWRTLNGGASWQAINDFFPALTIGAMANHPDTPDTVYLGTGEVYPSNSVSMGDLRGAGLFKSTNFGVNWGDPLPGTENWQYVNDIVISPSDSDVVLVSNNNGIFRSTDGGMNWPTFAELFVSIADLEFHPTDGDQAVAGGGANGQIYYWDADAMPSPRWRLATSTGGTLSGRVSVAYARSNPSIVYAAMQGDGDSLWRSTDGGENFAQMASSIGFYWGQAWYNNCLWVDPTDANTVVLGGGALMRTSDGGATFRAIGLGSHADRHVLLEHPGYDGVANKILYQGSDGGVYRTNDIRRAFPTTVCSGDGDCADGEFCDGGTCSFRNFGWTELNNTLGITQFNHAAVHDASGVILGGTQDNGTQLFDPVDGSEAWAEFSGGDGGYSAIDPADSNFMYSAYIVGRAIRSTNGGTSAGYIHALTAPFIDRNGRCCDSNGLDAGANCVNTLTAPFPPGVLADACTATSLFYAPMRMDPNNSNRLYVGGASLWRCDNAKAATPSWSAVKPPLVLISTIDVAPGDSDVVWVGHNSGTVFMTTNGTAATPTWTRVDMWVEPGTGSTRGLPRRYCTRLRIDPSDPERVYAAFGGYASNNVWMTENSGQSWTLIAGTAPANLPAIHVSSIAIHPNQPGWLYAATDLGVFASENNGQSWSASTEGPANVIVNDLIWRRRDGGDTTDLLAVTYGRGIFEALDVLADCNANGQGDFLDLAGASDDCNANAVPDECEPDCNANGTPDDCDVATADPASFFASMDPAVFGRRSSAIVSADFNADGFDDLAATSWNTEVVPSNDVAVILNRGEDASGNWLGWEAPVLYGTGGLPAIPWSLTTLDHDGDGDVDLAALVGDDTFPPTCLTCSKVFIARNNGSGLFSTWDDLGVQATSVIPSKESIAAGDIDGDGDDETIVADTERRDLVVPFPFQLINLAGQPQSVDTGFFNLDGDVDVVVATTDPAQVKVFINDGNGFFGDDVWTLSVSGALASVRAVDLDGDGIDDVLVAVGSDLLIIENAGSNALSIVADAVTIPATTVRSADFDRDGVLDILTVSDASTDFTIWLDSEGYAPRTVSGSPPSVSATAADVDGDGFVDVAGIVEASFVWVYGNDTTIDCNENGIPDACDLDAGWPDADADGLLDDCEFEGCDVDLDGDCDLRDRRLLEACMGGPGVPCPDTLGNAPGGSPDLDGDFDVDLRDYALFQLRFSGDLSCCVAHQAPGCADFPVHDCVCSFLPECCSTTWNQACVDAVLDLGCGVCFEQTDCGNGSCDAPETCASCPEDCGACTGPCCNANGTPGCNDEGTVACVCAVVPACCTAAWDETCADLAGTACGGCCGDGTCGDRENCFSCPTDCTNCPPGCGDTFCQVGEDCTNCALDCGLCDGSCCIANGSVGCTDPAVQACVCAADPFCCDVTWDNLCAVGADDCGSCDGSCCSPNGTPGCDDETIEACVCAIDPYCCNIDWDSICVDEVEGLQCGSCMIGDAPTAVITQPAQDTGTSNPAFVYDGFDQNLGLWYKDVTLRGQADDLEDGPLAGDSLVWTTNRTDIQPSGQGLLGTGVEITVRLYSNVCTGVMHTITLTVTDSDGNAISVQRMIFIWTLC